MGRGECQGLVAWQIKINRLRGQRSVASLSATERHVLHKRVGPDRLAFSPRFAAMLNHFPLRETLDATTPWPLGRVGDLPVARPHKELRLTWPLDSHLAAP